VRHPIHHPYSPEKKAVIPDRYLVPPSTAPVTETHAPDSTDKEVRTSPVLSSTQAFLAASNPSAPPPPGYIYGISPMFNPAHFSMYSAYPAAPNNQLLS